ncbi:NADH:ubiquinone oxidoreductase [Flavobacterium akiainvivens]|uniref:NADH:ubiquinone oxidoreductase n=1 Tax=Flavobacterium akiainvivens TaxID=1202724 RepID=A0A0M8ML59_9FLAO|nr:GxxExxY protein [Flavobacterium akiainvivens]KOS07788.1 NADH:ubiquinone oxidoreductase [Flavobacterium akiainvivens]SFQ26364.1 GxxExxY protein [Flavobacterium akiainvivens]
MELIHKEEYYKIVGICMEVHKHLGGGLLEIVYKDALEYEFRKNNIPFAREKEYFIEYKDIVLPHKFYADFVVYDDIILEVKAVTGIVDIHVAQTLNYVRLIRGQLGIIANFNSKSLEHRRIIK